MKLLLVIAIIVALGLIVFSAYRTSESSSSSPRTVTEVPNDDSNPVKLVGPPTIYPDPATTPGATNPEVTPDNFGDTICNPNWSTKSIRPSSAYTSRLKREQIKEWGLNDTDPKDYEEDHLIPLELGGHPSDARNLWPELYSPAPGARQKDRVENQLHKEVCESEITLERAQHIVATDWYACYLNLESGNSCK
jgi:hypothetical protein